METKEQRHQRYLRTKAKVAEQTKEYILTHYQQYKEYQQRYRETHREELREQQYQYREIHRDSKYIGEPSSNVDAYQQPPVKNKKETKAVYEKWLRQLKLKEPYLTGERLHWNQLMQESIQTLMGRRKHTIEEIKDKINSLQELLTKLQEQRRKTAKLEEKDNLTRQISSTSASLACYKSRYKTLLPKPKEHPQKISNAALKIKLAEIEQKAKQLIANAKDEQEKKMWEERLQICKLRVKYSYC